MPRTVILSFDDAVANHRTFVAPLLKELGFNATFFICRWGDEWRASHSEYLLDEVQVREISEMGFDVGNHTWNHSVATNVPVEEFSRDVDRLEQFLAGAGVPKSVSFAYPCGDYTPEAVEALRKRGFLSARTVRDCAINPESDDMMCLPAACINDKTPSLLEEMLAQCTEERPVAILYHGVPDIVHPWVTRDPQAFTREMNILRDGGFRVISFRDYAASRQRKAQE